MVYVYATQGLADKKAFSLKIANLMTSKPGNCVVFGDFNVVRKKEERFNSHFSHYTAAFFNNFIHDSGLIDLNMGGRRFTYLCDLGFKLSKLDRFLVCPNFLAKFGQPRLWPS